MQPAPRAFKAHHGAVYDLVRGEDGTFLSAGGDGQVLQWDLQDEQIATSVAKVSEPVFRMAMAGAGNRFLYLGTQAGNLHVLDRKERREMQLLQAHRKGIFKILVQQEHVICAAGDGMMSIWHAEEKGTLRAFRSIPVVDSKLRDLLEGPDGSLLVACGDGTIRVFDAHFNEVHTLDAHSDAKDPSHVGVTSLAMDPSKHILISGGKDGLLRSWNMAAGYTAIGTLPAHRGAIYAICFSPAGAVLATASRDKTVKIWRTDPLDILHRLDHSRSGHTHSVNTLLWIEGHLLSAGDDRHIKAWNIPEV